MPQSQNMPTFSFIVPVYNTVDYLERCLASIAAQTYRGLECLCVDDGSSDTSGALLDAFARKDARFKVVHQPNGGVGTARNRALAMLCGDWVVFCDSDDFVSPRLLSVLMSAMHASPETDFWSYGILQGKTVDFGVSEHEPSVRFGIKTFPKGRTVCVWGGIIRSPLLKGIAFSNVLIGEDTLFLQEACARVRSFGEIDAPLYGYVAREGSATHRRTVQSVSDCFRFRKEFLCRFREGRGIATAYRDLMLRFNLFITPAEVLLGGFTHAERRQLVREWWEALSVLPEASTVRFGGWCRAIRFLGKVRAFRGILFICSAMGYILHDVCFHLGKNAWKIMPSRTQQEGKEACISR